MASQNDRKSLNEDAWKGLTHDYDEKGITLALGAGVSKGCNLPDWCELLKRIAVRLYGDKGQSVVSEMIAEGYPLPAIASMLEIDCPSKKDFTEEIRDALYGTFPFYHKDSADFVEYVKNHNKTLRAVAALCTSKVDDKFVTNHRIHAIINTNYDATLRAYSSARYPLRSKRAKKRDYILRTVERPSAGFIQGRINVYHVHGFFQFQKHLEKQDEEAPDIRAFTEQEYFDFFNQPNSFFNYTFLYLLREYSVLFIGMSLMDENVRRLLHYSRSEICESYKKEEVEPAEAERKSLRHYSIQKRRRSKSVNDMTEKSLKRLGVRVLWIENFNREIPELLERLYESTYDETRPRWADVY